MGPANQGQYDTAVKILASLSIRLSYRTERDDLIKDFYIPCLEASVLYRRAAGYFSSAGVLFRFEWVTDLTHCKLSVATGHGGYGDGREAVVRFGVGFDPAVVH